jgi:nicotinic acid mononucleotide adenylyltransferase
MEEKPKSDHAVFTFGRFNPPTTGHAKLVNTVVSHAWKHKADHFIFASHSHDAKKNPLGHREKIKFLQKFFPHANIDKGDGIKTPVDAVKHLSKHYKHVTMLVGDDRQQEFSNLLHKYNGKDYNIPHLEIKSAGQRDPDSEGVEGMSASKMRDHAQRKNFTQFKKGVPNPEHAKELYKAVRKGMKLENFQQHFKALFLVGGPGSGKDFIITSLLDEVKIVELPLDKLVKAITEQTNIPELENYPSLLVNGTAENMDKIVISKQVLESMGYDTAMVYVYTTDEESKARNDERIARGVKTFSEEVRHEKYANSITNLHHYITMFNEFNVFDNSSDFSSVGAIKKQEILGWLRELGLSIGSFYENSVESESAKIWLMENTKKPNMGMKLPVAPKPTAVPSNTQHTSILKGYKRVKVGGFWKLVKEMGGQPSGIGGSESGGDTDKYERGAKDYVKPSKKTNIKMKPPKDKGKKATPSPPNFFDQRMGMVPSGGVGITVSHYEHPEGEKVIQEKSLEKLRKNMTALINNIDQQE